MYSNSKSIRNQTYTHQADNKWNTKEKSKHLQMEKYTKNNVIENAQK